VRAGFVLARLLLWVECSPKGWLVLGLIG